MKPKLERMLFETAEVWSKGSTCLRAQVGAVLATQDGHVISTGYNGSEPGKPHCTDVGCLMVEGHCVRTIHAEQNALAQAAQRGTSTRGSVLFCTHEPCFSCTMLLRSAGVVEFHWIQDYKDNRKVEND